MKRLRTITLTTVVIILQSIILVQLTMLLSARRLLVTKPHNIRIPRPQPSLSRGFSHSIKPLQQVDHDALAEFEFWSPAEHKRIRVGPDRSLPPRVDIDQLRTSIDSPVDDYEGQENPLSFTEIAKTTHTVPDYPTDGIYANIDPHNFERQRKFEEEAVEDSAKEYQTLSEEMARLGRGSHLAYGKTLLSRWYSSIKQGILEEQKKMNLDGEELADLGVILSVEKLSVIAMHVVLSRTLAGEDVTSHSITHYLQETCRAELSIQTLRVNDPDHHKRILNAIHLGGLNRVVLDLKMAPLNTKLKQLYGSVLLDAVLNNATAADGISPAFERVKIAVGGGKQHTVVRLSPEIRDGITSHKSLMGFVQARHFPMVVPPRPWTSPRRGGYLTISTDLVRSRGYYKQINELQLINARDPYQLQTLFESLNALSETPWRINNRMRDIIQDAIDRGGSIGELPTMVDLPLPTKPQKGTPMQLSEWKREYRKALSDNHDLMGRRADVNYKLGVANKFADDVIYFPHNLDFRGRAYPIPPHLNHLGNDMCRSLMLFAEGKPLGEEGLDWIKIHLANLYGMDKIPFSERIQFVDKNMDKIRASVENPLDGDRWWLKADSPWQFLAASKEMFDAIDSGDPSSYVSHLPVHQDGTCNGLQHYAALGGDVLGAKHVNLLPSDRPQDVYSGVMDLVKQRVEEDYASGDKYATLVRGHITRKVVKQTVMTSVYGVTFTGAIRQIAGQLEDLKFLQDEKLIFPCAAYLTRHVFASLGEIFLGAQTLMDWLAVAAKKIAVAGKDVTWTTPTGLFVIQPYKKITAKEQVVTTVQVVDLKKMEQRSVNVARQKSAFPPNYIHSLDSSHMLMTALEMKKQDLTFASVHDSYWTHASTVPRMNEILREKFIDLHSSPLLENLLQEFHKAYPEVEFPPLPEKGDLDLREVQKSKYFFH
ncbi:DNA-dependent RNA polymerase [Planoprotostelium fungivorum]|uniref:DNA-directed RNA polymerase n=1 Tax=Planoprotostelium fungivorum TaxID=1890364 RepID=A0A2P6NKS7_9EUKA|nr:DNA-dependent RNA polymerase [Planoprotostelium fungivorum]